MNDAAKATRQTLEQAAKYETRLHSANAEHLDLSGGKFGRLEADFMAASDANLTDASFYNAGLFDCDFKRADCSRAVFESATLFQCNFHQAHGEAVRFRKAKAEINWFKEARLPQARFNHALLGECSFIRAHMEFAYFDEAQGEKIDFTDATLTNASFRGAQFPRALFARAALQGADFALADLSGADFRGAHLQGASFLGARLEGALFDAAAPATQPAPPSADVADCVHAYLTAGDGAAALALYKAYQPQRGERWIINPLGRSSGQDKLDPQAVLVLLREVLASSDLLLLHEASREAACFAQMGFKLDLARELGALLGSDTFVRESEPGVRRLTVDPGMQAALALGYLGELDVLRAGLNAKKRVPERCAAGLIVALTRDARTPEAQALLADTRRSVMSGIVAGLGDRIDSAGWRAKDDEPIWGDPEVAIGILEELKTHPDAKQAKAAQVKRREVNTMIEWLERRKRRHSP